MKRMMLIVVFTLSCLLIISAGKPIMAADGWDFSGRGGNIWKEGGYYNLYVVVDNNSSNRSYGSGGTYYGSVVVTVSVSSPDAGVVYFGSDRIEIANGGSGRAEFSFHANRDYGILTVEYQIAAPTGYVFDTGTFRRSY